MRHLSDDIIQLHHQLRFLIVEVLDVEKLDKLKSRNEYTAQLLEDRKALYDNCAKIEIIPNQLVAMNERMRQLLAMCAPALGFRVPAKHPE